MKTLALLALLSLSFAACATDDDAGGNQQRQTGTGGSAGAAGGAGTSGVSAGGGAGASGAGGGAGASGAAGGAGASGAAGSSAECPDPTPPPASRECVTLAEFQSPVTRCQATRQDAEAEAAATCPSDAQRGDCADGIQSVRRTTSFTGEYVECFYDAAGELVGGVWVSDHGPARVTGRSPACTRADACPADAGADVDCSAVGCGMPPLCAVGCQEPCGCCTCNDGEAHPTDTSLACAGGCWAPAPGG
ncbi:MAG: hypothetical protein IT376_00045 [Polyangiaceae bacterium]|nr:hypothetical protein [Polyangiaceae bacterium]